MSDPAREARLADETEVFRAIKPSWVHPDTGRLSAAAFLRSARDRDGLSVSRSRARAETTYQRQRGVARLLAGDVRGVSLAPPDWPLGMIPDPTDLDPDHALITGLPDPFSPDDGEKDAANQAADALVALASYPA